MSGGVDSSVAAALLKEEGYDCVGMHLRFWSDPLVKEGDESVFPQNKCCSVESLEDARRVAAQLGIPFYVMNTAQPFKEKIVDYFLEGYRSGETPNPCVECNRNIKFGMLLKRAMELGADFLATGHYVKKITKTDERSESGQASAWLSRLAGGKTPFGNHELWMAKDKMKDQSYFLYHLTQEKLSRVFFPLGDLEKSEVYALAQKYNLSRVQEKKESQGICFFPEATPQAFLKRHLDQSAFAPGPIETVSGEIIGQHAGLPNYTIGQRKGIGIGGMGGGDSEPWFVSKIDRSRNTLVVGRKEDVYKKEIVVGKVNFVFPSAPGFREGAMSLRCEVRIRYRAKPENTRLETFLENGELQAKITFEEPVFGISPGQSAVFYDGEKVLGGGKICH